MQKTSFKDTNFPKAGCVWISKKKTADWPFFLWSISYNDAISLILVFVKEEVFFGGIIGPQVFDTFVYFTFILNFL
jgi:hypothetical protein